MKLQQFNGGLATRLEPQFLSVNEAVEYLNIDNSLGSLVPVKDKVPTTIPAQAFNWYSYSLNKWFSAPIFTYYTEYNSFVYQVDGSTTPLVTDSSASYRMGIVPPTSFVTSATNQSTVVTDATLSSVTSLVAAALPNQDTTYIFINDSAGVYSLSFEATLTASTTPRVKTSIAGRAQALSTKTLNNFTYNIESKSRVVTAAADGTKRIITISNPRTKTFGSNGIKVFRQYKDVWYLVGTLANASSTLTDNIEDISANAVLDLTKSSPLQGIYQYVFTYYDNNRGRESGPSPVSAEFDLSDSGIINLSGLPASSDPTVTHKRIYRVGGEITSFTLVAQISNATATFLDNIPDVSIDGTVLSTQTYLPAPNGLKFLCTANAMMFAAQGTKLRYTPIGLPESWPELFYILFESAITSVTIVYTGILVCTVNKTYIVTGTGPNSLAVSPISLDQGCVSHTSVQVLKGSAIWASLEGICISAGDVVTVVSRQKLGKLSLSPRDSELLNEVYYVLNNDGICYCYDTAFGSIFKKYNFGVTSLAKQDTDLYGYADGILCKLFSASNYLTMSYLSPRFIEGSFTQAKTYKQVYIYSKGDIIVYVYINDVLVTTQILNTTDNHTILVPQELQRGNYIQLKIEGTGEVFEIEYDVGRG